MPAIMSAEDRAALLASANENNLAVRAALVPKMDALLAAADEVVALVNQMLPTGGDDDTMRIQTITRNAVHSMAVTLRSNVVTQLPPPVTPVPSA